MGFLPDAKSRPAQPEDNRKTVEMIHADSILSMSHNGKTINRFIGRVQFMHNGALMSCDSAYLFSSSEFEAYSRVVVVKEGTTLYGDQLHYDGATNMAKVRGKLVRMTDSTATLRTQHLDFNTKQNIGHFFNGGTIANKDNLLESVQGYYYSNDKLFVFNDSVSIRNETYDILCESGNYNTETDIAVFTGATSIWHKDGFLSCHYGWYDKPRDYFHFSKNAYLQSDKQEVWADSIFYDRLARTGDLYGHVQMHDSTHSLIVFGDEAHFNEDPEEVIVTKQPSMAYYTIEENRPDTAFLRGDTLHFVTELNPIYLPKDTIATADTTLLTADALAPPAIDTTLTLADTLLPAAIDTTLTLADTLLPAAIDTTLKLADTLLPAAIDTTLTTVDTLLPTAIDSTLKLADTLLPAAIDTTLKLADTLLPAAIDTTLKLADTLLPAAIDTTLQLADTLLPVAIDTTLTLADTLLPAATDTTFTLADTLAPATDTLLVAAPDSSIHKFFAYHHVRSFRSNLQSACDSFAYSSLDSLGRMFGRPVMWNEEQQISSNEIHFLTDQQQILRADFLQAAFIITHEQDTFYNQVKGRDIIAYFRDNDIYLADITGGAQTVYYLQEDSIVANGNLAESVTMQIELKKRKIQRIKYYSQPVKSDTYPLKDLPPEKATLKGYEWRDAERPKSRWEICREIPHASRKEEIANLSKPTFPITERINGVR
jgi:lipopolysaccharide export system protein LptA